MSADSYFAIGSTHQVCQDYAISDGDFVVLSDGCSSAKDSDWGARFICRAAYNILKQTKPDYIDKFIQNVMIGARSYAEKLELHEDCLAATFFCAFKQHKLITVCFVGDGYIITKKDNKIKIMSYMYDTGAPWYPYYYFNEDLTNVYLTHYGHGKLVNEDVVIEDGKLISSDTTSYGMKAEATRVPGVLSFVTDEVDMLGISSDGLKSFVQQLKGNTSITNKLVSDEQVIKDLFQFKTVEGQFVHRRCQRFLRDYQSQNIKHTDDFSLGVLN